MITDQNEDLYCGSVSRVFFPRVVVLFGFSLGRALELRRQLAFWRCGVNFLIGDGARDRLGKFGAAFSVIATLSAFTLNFCLDKHFWSEVISGLLIVPDIFHF